MAITSTDTELRILTAEQKASYERDGYLLLPGLIGAEWLERLQAASEHFVDESRKLTASDARLDIEADHTAENPRLRRLTSPVDNHPTFEEFSLRGPVAQVAIDLLGNPARYHHSKLNYKWSGGGQAVDWHQDIQYWPHSDFTPLTIGVYLDDVDDPMGPMGILPGSHKGELYDLYDEDDRWTGSMSDADLASLDLDSVAWLKGAAGSVTVHNACAVHGSPPNDSDRVRPLLLQTYSAADSYPLLGVGTNGRTGGLSGTLVGDGSPRWVTVDGRRMPAAPDWSKGGYTTIFAVQEGDDFDE